jgi:hybrid cluster-associated redox disulfide protein
MQALTLQTTMAELLEECPAAGPVLARRGMACVGCVMAPFETVAEAALAYGADPAELLREVTGAPRDRRAAAARRRHAR